MLLATFFISIDSLCSRQRQLVFWNHVLVEMFAEIPKTARQKYMLCYLWFKNSLNSKNASGLAHAETAFHKTNYIFPKTLASRCLHPGNTAASKLAYAPPTCVIFSFNTTGHFILLNIKAESAECGKITETRIWGVSNLIICTRSLSSYKEWVTGENRWKRAFLRRRLNYPNYVAASFARVYELSLLWE